MTAPVHPQLMDPARDPEELIRASVYWWPLLFPTRTEVLDHLMLTGGNGYEWGADGQIRSVFAHIEPDYDRLDRYEAEARKWEADGFPDMAQFERAEHARLLAIRADCRHLARTYGPVRMTEDYGPAGGAACAPGRTPRSSRSGAPWRAAPRSCRWR